MNNQIPSTLRLITISGLSASGKDTITNLLTPEVGWPVMTVSQIMREHCKKIGSELPTVPDLEFNQQIENQIKYQIAHAHQLILASNRTAGYHAWVWKQHQLKDTSEVGFDSSEVDGKHDHIFSILITAPQAIRIQRLAQRDKLSIPAAQNHVVNRDRIDLKVYQQLLGVNPLNPQYFDLIIDTSEHTPNQAINLILNKIKLETGN